MPSRPRLFLDASVWIAAAASPEGGSSLVLELCKAGKAEILATQLVLREVEKNIQAKFKEDVLLRYYRLLGETRLVLVPLPSSKALDEASQVVAIKDAHILAGAREGNATHIVTLDRKHFLGEDTRAAILPIKACTPREFLRDILAEYE